MLLHCQSSLWFSLSTSFSIDNSVDRLMLLLLTISTLHLIFPIWTFLYSFFIGFPIFLSLAQLFVSQISQFLIFCYSHNCDISLFLFFLFCSRLLISWALFTTTAKSSLANWGSHYLSQCTPTDGASRSLAKLRICKEKHMCVIVALLQHSNVLALLWSTNWLF